MTDATHDLRSRQIGALPLLQHVFDRLGLDRLLAEHLPSPDPRLRLPTATAIGVLLRNVLVGRRPLYGLQEWAMPFAPAQLGLPDSGAALLNDDRLGRALDELFDADRASLMTALVVRAIEAFDVDLKQFHNDSTSITFSGQYAEATGRTIRGKRAVKVNHGYNKDHRPDLKQLLWILTVSADGAVPIHYRLCDGSTVDDKTHIATWDALCALVGGPDFLYVADCKLCSRTNMDYIASQKGRFITVLPRSRKEDPWFRRYVQDHTPAWEVVSRPAGAKDADPNDVWHVADAPNRSSEGYRIVWVWSTAMAERDQHARLAALQKAHDAVQALHTKLQGPRARLRDRPAVAEAVERILAQAGAAHWADVEIVEKHVDRFKQAGPGRPSAKTRYVRSERVRFELVWRPKADVIAYDAKSDGMYPLITNCDDLAAADVLRKYKYQPTLEKRHEQLKTVYAVAPAFLKNEGRIEALLLVYFIALLVQALIERDVRLAMAAEGIPRLPLYPEERLCRAPTANRILDVFEHVQRHELVKDGAIVQAFEPTLTDLQITLLRLLGAPRTIYPGT